jgi:phospholipid/cholesterol/gamma-HCH transport system ATP-binding protein
MSAPAAPLLAVRDLALDLGDGEALLGLSFELGAGEALQLCGPVDAGGAALRALVGLQEADAGQVRLLGEDPHALPRRASQALLARVGWLPREGALLANLTLRENLLLPLRFHLGGRGAPDAAPRALARLGLAEAPDVRPERVTLGLRRRVALARAMLLEPALLLLDGPLHDLDDEDAAALTAAILAYAREPGRAVLVASPYPDLASALSARLVHLQVHSP